MKNTLLALCLGLGIAAGLAHAREENAPTPQQERMRSCSSEAKEKNLKGEERKQFMRQCLKGNKEDKDATAAAAPQRTEQQQRMADCSKEAKEKNLKGAERRQFMSECLKKK